MAGIFTIRDGEPQDGELIARNVLAAVGYDMFGEPEERAQWMLPKMAEVCRREDTLYSYTRTRVACVDGAPVGSLTAYPGDGYLELRKFTWGLFGNEVANPDSVADIECRPGEFYLDSMALLPEFRGGTYEYYGTTDRIGHLLMLDGIKKGRDLGFKKISLIVEQDRPRLRSYYSALGFRTDGELTFFGDPYYRMVLITG